MARKRKTGRSGAIDSISSQLKPITDFPETAEDSEFFVRMFKHEFDSGPLRKAHPLTDAAVILTRDRWGSEEPELGSRLVANLLLTLVESNHKPQFIFLVNTAVRLACSSSASLGSLQRLEAMGARILINKTSLDHFKLEPELRVGEVVSMLEMVETCFQVEKVLTF